jgi:RecJ-like exonuclease
LIGSITHTEIDVDKFMSWGSYPNFSKVTSRVNKEAPQPRITLGLLSDSIAFRCDGIPRFDLHSLIENLKNEFPHALIDGGGHICAGTIRFSPGAREEVLSFIKKYLDGLERQ